MATEFHMPKLGLTMESGKILRWLVGDGAEVSPGQPILVIETDKVESEVESTSQGRIHRTGEIDETYDCGALIGWFLAEGEAVPNGDAPAPLPVAAPVVASPSVPGPVVASPPAPPAGGPAEPAPAPVGGHRLLVSPNARRLAARLGVDVAGLTGTGPSGRVVSEDVEGAANDPAGRVAAPRGRVMASPNARRVAAEQGVDLAAVAGSGPGGRIVSEDVGAPPPVPSAPAPTAVPPPPSAPTPTAVPPPPSAPTPTAAVGVAGSGLASVAARQLADLLGVDLASVPATAPDGRVTRDDVAAHVRTLLAAGPAPVDPPASPLVQSPTRVVPFTGMRGIIAERMHGSLQAMAQLTLSIDADMRGVLAERQMRKSKGDPVPGITDYVIAAVAVGLREHPIVNSQVTDDGVALLPDVHVGVAVALDDGLMVPVVRNTLELSIEELSAETTRLAEAARAGKLQLGELEGGTFSVTALGMYGIDAFTPVINPPNTAILGVGRIRDEVEWSDQGIQKRPTMTLSLTWDHRAFDGAPAAEFVGTVRDWLRSPGTHRQPG
ncbi:MAG: 2-oxo acid dehydrogenase subunit E2 [Actinomycetia bacterium]|nr:2-oxo acid dehydrogenase subunit E2 [Actinomycetes bacterium]